MTDMCDNVSSAPSVLCLPDKLFNLRFSFRGKIIHTLKMALSYSMTFSQELFLPFYLSFKRNFFWMIFNFVPFFPSRTSSIVFYKAFIFFFQCLCSYFSLIFSLCNCSSLLYFPSDVVLTDTGLGYRLIG